MDYEVKERLYRSADGKKIVLEGDVRARFLVNTPGDILNEKPVIEKLDTGQKALKPDEDKSIKPGENKGGTKDPPPPHPDTPVKRATVLNLFNDQDKGK